MRRLVLLLTLAACAAAPDAARASGHLTVVKSHVKAGTVTGNGLNATLTCGLDCSSAVKFFDHAFCPPGDPCEPQVVGVTTTLAPGWALAGMVGCDEEGDSCSATMSENRTVRVDYADVQDPELTLTAAPAQNAKVRGHIAFKATASDNDAVARLELYRDGTKIGDDATAPYELSVNTRELSDGDKAFAVRAIDVNGRTTTITRNLTVDNKLPTVSITGGPADSALVGAGNVHYAFEAADETSGVAKLECALATEPWTDCDTHQAHAVKDAADGDHQFLVRATDAAGNVSLVASRHFTMDGTSPSLGILTGPADGALVGKPGAVDYTFDAADEQSAISRVECAIDAVYGDCDGTGSHGVRGLADGAHAFSVRATDTAGNQTVVTRSFTIDVTAPSVAITGGPAPESTIGMPAAAEFPYGASDATSEVAKVECDLDGKGFGPCTGPAAHKLAGLAHGRHTLSVRAADAAGNVATATRAFNVDIQAPETAIDTASAGTSSAFTFSASEGGSTFRCRLYAEGATPPAFGDCAGASGSHSSSGLAFGDYVFEVIATDALGNTDPTPAKRAFRVQMPADPPPPPPPVERISSPVDHYWSNLRKRSRPTKLVVSGIPAGATVEILCKGKGCRFRKKAVPFKAITLKLAPLFKKMRVRTGGTIEIRIVKPGAVGKVVVFTMRPKGKPLSKVLCLPPGAAKPAAC